MADRDSTTDSTQGFDEDLETWGGVVSAAPARLAQGSSIDDEESLVVSLRPSRFDEYVGQDHVRSNLQIACNASKRRGDALDHVLLHGPPGLGKTSLARIIAGELGVGFKSTSGPAIERPGDLAAILTSLSDKDVLFIDEIHRLPRVVEEVLYPAMEDYELDIVIGQGPAARSIKIPVRPFTLVGATTRSGMLTSPLRDRFGIIHRLDFYSKDDLQRIVKRSSEILEVSCDDGAAAEIAARSRGTPRIANRLLKRARDFAQECAAGALTADTSRKALELLEIDSIGLDRTDRAFLLLMIEKFDGGPVGIDTLAAALGEDRETLEDVFEPYLLQEGFIARTKRGREATERAYKHLGKKFEPRASQGALFGKD